MTLLILGVLLWTGAHLFKRVAPAARAGLQARMGNASRGVFAALLFLSLVLMVLGYRQQETDFVYVLPDFTRHINNLLMLVAVVLFGMSSTSGRLRGRLRHPMLLGTITWAVAHLLVNGTVADVVLFGGILLWAVAEIVLINAQTTWQRPAPGEAKGDIKLAVISVAVYLVIGLIHGWVGPTPFG